MRHSHCLSSPLRNGKGPGIASRASEVSFWKPDNYCVVSAGRTCVVGTIWQTGLAVTPLSV
jgi:hypothetical protein